MELCNFKGTLYGKLETHLFVWDSEWETFRPIENIGWNGSEIVAIDLKYKKDIFDPWYGFGTTEMKQLCRKLTDTTDLGVSESGNIPWLKGEWWRDRECSFTSNCVSRSPASWQKYIKYMNSKAKTLRRHIHSRATKRLLPKSILTTNAS